MYPQTYGNVVPTPARDLKLPLSLDDLQTQIERMGKASEELSARVEKVCRPEPPQVQQGNTGNASPLPPQSEYVENIQRKSNQIRHICEVLENIISRLEL